MAEQFKNPFDPRNMREGGGLWDGRVVNITRSKTIAKPLVKDGAAMIRNDGSAAVLQLWTITGIAEDSEKEYTQEYELKGLIATPDGKGFTKADGTFGVLRRDSDAGKFADRLVSAGFDVNLLCPDGKIDVSALEGAKIKFKAEDRLDKKTKQPVVNNKGFAWQDFYPVEFVGFGTGAKKGNGVDDAFKLKAAEYVNAVLVEAGGTLTQIEVVKALSKKLAGNADLPAIVGLVSKREVPGVKVEGATFSL